MPALTAKAFKPPEPYRGPKRTRSGGEAEGNAGKGNGGSGNGGGGAITRHMLEGLVGGANNSKELEQISINSEDSMIGSGSGAPSSGYTDEDSARSISIGLSTESNIATLTEPEEGAAGVGLPPSAFVTESSPEQSTINSEALNNFANRLRATHQGSTPSNGESSALVPETVTSTASPFDSDITPIPGSGVTPIQTSRRAPGQRPSMTARRTLAMPESNSPRNRYLDTSNYLDNASSDELIGNSSSDDSQSSPEAQETVRKLVSQTSRDAKRNAERAAAKAAAKAAAPRARGGEANASSWVRGTMTPQRHAPKVSKEKATATTATTTTATIRYQDAGY